ncbi:MAG: hypothetical protein HKO14_02625 [Silicimonas sp.]|nr:hypothetical protein [Silicimonas sp.]
MDSLTNFDLEDSRDISALRNGDDVALGMALAEAGCSVEAAALLRPHRKVWSKGDQAEIGAAALDAVAWWNRNWRDVARARQAGRHGEVLRLVGDHARSLWDQPALLLHLAWVARATGRQALAGHLLRRVIYLCHRGVPGIEMKAFHYAAEAGLVDILVDEGRIDDALSAFEALTPNPGNAMAHQLQGAELLVLSGRLDAAMVEVAKILMTANDKRSGWSANVRRDFTENAQALGPLRARDDWRALISDPAAYLARSL